jgi:quinol monooxygenase YgiN
MTKTTFTPQDDVSVIVSMIREQLVAPECAFSLMMRLSMKADAGEKVAAAFAEAQGPTLAEPGAITFQLNRTTAEPDRFVIYERWRSLDDLDSHLRMPHTTRLREIFESCLAAPPEMHVLTPVGA